MRWGVIALTAVLVTVPAPAAHADGDPASDVLFFQNVFLPYPSPSGAASQGLISAIRTENQAGFRLKVAVIATRADLGSAAPLFTKPKLYARFLGIELAYFFRGTLLVVAPSGYGVYAPGASTATQQRAVETVSIHSASADDLVRAAGDAVRKLAAASPPPAQADRIPPFVHAYGMTIHQGTDVQLRFEAWDNSGTSSENVRVYAPGDILLANVSTPMQRTRKGLVHTVPWRAPRGTFLNKLQFCVVGIDPSRNTSSPSCATLKIVA
jgi:hypothetical protein